MTSNGYSNLKLFCGTSNFELGDKIAKRIGVTVGRCTVRRFSDGEIFTEIEENVREADVFIIQSTCAPANENLMELLVMIDAFKRASAARITAVIPYYGYARQDRKVQPRTPISAKLVADLLTAAGTNRILAMDLHAGQIQGFFNIPFDHLFATPVFLEYIEEKKLNKDLVMVSPDAGGTERARAYAKRLEADLAIIDKRREKANESEVMNIIGSVKGKNIIIVDDMVDTAGTMVQAAHALKDQGAKLVYGMCTHPVLSGSAVDRIAESPMEGVLVCDTIPLTEKAKSCSKIHQLSVSVILSEAIRRIHTGDSVSSLFV
ncbi:MAG: phosphoribosylpyrophosphate synthetase [Deltaproteobacteria bacterium RIFCSPLOWO2_12_FULL_50_11]|nr:MAG: phosphoribosylpyrophosphate synthetase [Deltaproteobacteria bacterium RIFCSPLOWO2_12_FULL_50_11]